MENQPNNNPTVKEEIKAPATQTTPVTPGNLQVAKPTETEKVVVGDEKVAGTPSQTL